MPKIENQERKNASDARNNLANLDLTRYHLNIKFNRLLSSVQPTIPMRTVVIGFQSGGHLITGSSSARLGSASLYDGSAARVWRTLPWRIPNQLGSRWVPGGSWLQEEEATRRDETRSVERPDQPREKEREREREREQQVYSRLSLVRMILNTIIII